MGPQPYHMALYPAASAGFETVAASHGEGSEGAAAESVF